MTSRTKKRLLRILDFVVSQNRNYGIYGAGKFAGEMMGFVETMTFPLPTAVFDDAPKIRTLNGINVYPTAEITSHKIDELILGSDTFQVEMRRNLASYTDAIRPIDIYSGDDPLDVDHILADDGRVSETSKVRDTLSKYCLGDGIDVGYGGDPIVDTAICMDQPHRYASYRNHPQHLHGDAQNLYWFRDQSLDYVYSSHVLEDFPNTSGVINEWLRILKVGGYLVLFLPDEQRYRDLCRQNGKPPNSHHIHENFSLEHVKSLVGSYRGVRIIHENFPSHDYSFELVLQKTF